jgi:hypothetical protein
MADKHNQELLCAAQEPYHEIQQVSMVAGTVRVQQKEVQHFDYAWSLPFDDVMASAYELD